MTLGLPFDFFARELLVVVAYATAAFVCAMRWQEGRWARVGAFAAALGGALTAFSLLAWVLYSNDFDALIEFRSRNVVEDISGWLGVLALAGVLVAIVMDRRPGPEVREPQDARSSAVAGGTALDES